MQNENSNLIAPHLLLHDMALQPGAEWAPQSPGWLFVHVRSGIGYCLEKQTNSELPTGAVLVMQQKFGVSIRASQLSGLNLSFFFVVPEFLTGLITLGEQARFENAATRRELSFQLLSPSHPVSSKFDALYERHNRSDFSFRLSLLELLALTFGTVLDEQGVAEAKPPMDARERLRQFLEQTLAAEWLNLGFTHLVQRVNCTPRHLSRIFRDVAGMSFREKQAKIRLTRASELLVNTEIKVVDVALDSGFQSLSLFNLMFRKRYGLSPGRWRKQSQNQSKKIYSHRRLALIES